MSCGIRKQGSDQKMLETVKGTQGPASEELSTG